eukprot:1832211-Alexandrium_andersonii.AAC.1
MASRCACHRAVNSSDSWFGLVARRLQLGSSAGRVASPSQPPTPPATFPAGSHAALATPCSVADRVRATR